MLHVLVLLANVIELHSRHQSTTIASTNLSVSESSNQAGRELRILRIFKLSQSCSMLLDSVGQCWTVCLDIVHWTTQSEIQILNKKHE